VMVGEEAVGNASRKARSLGLGLLCQVHSHPGRDTRHSDGDDKLILMPFEGMLSLVAPDFGVSLRSLEDFSVHQFQNHRWTLCGPESVRSGLIVVPTMEDLR
jgi:proteasome lid subunit RPN8/RPN11